MNSLEHILSGKVLFAIKFYQLQAFTQILVLHLKPHLLTELYYFVEGSYPIYGNPNLKPEKSMAYEIGIDQK